MGIAIKRIVAVGLLCLVAVIAAPELLSALGDGPASPPPFLRKWGTIGSDNGSFSQPQGLAIDDSGNVYVADTGNSRIQKFTSAGVFITKWGTSGSDNGSFSQPQGVAVDAPGNVYVADSSNNRIQKFTGAGVFITKWGTSGSDNGSFSQPQGVAVDASGNVYVADSSNNRIQKFTGAGAYITQWGASGTDNGSFNQPHGMAVDSSGNVYVADTNNHRIQKFTGSGVFITGWGAFGSFDGQFLEPCGVAVDAWGNVYVADMSNKRIQKFTSFGTFVTRWGTMGFGDGEFAYPMAVAVDASGNVYVADTSNSRIQVFYSPPPPSVTTNSADNITATSAQLNGRLTDLGLAASANVSFQWTINSSNYTSANETAPELMFTSGNFSAELNSLSANTTYYFRAKAVGDSAAYGSEMTFSTQAAAPEVLLTVYETIVVSDSPVVLPPVILTVNESITVIDTPQILLLLVVYEGIAVNDALTIPTPVTVIAGGGGGRGEPPPGVTYVDTSSTAQGLFLQSFTANSDDGKVGINIRQWTTGRTREGNRLTEISVVPMATPPSPPANSNVIGLTYDFGPEGATFSLPITITLQYDPASIPVGVNVRDLVIAFYDRSTGNWVVLDDIIINPITRTISGNTRHFTAFTILAYTSLADFTTSAMTISPSEVKTGESVTISVDVTNAGDLTGSYDVVLKINSVVIDTEKVILTGKTVQKVVFYVTKDVTGSYTISIDSLSGTFTVKAVPPAPAPPAPTTSAAVAPEVVIPTPEAPAPKLSISLWLIIGVISAVIITGLVVWRVGLRRKV